ncbi:MAG: hypothetical protein R3F34_02860 [Planctomycetota bacterium]
MNRLPWLLLLLVAALGVLLFDHVRGNIGRGPDELLVSARSKLEPGSAAPASLVLRELDTALALARDEDRPELVKAILAERGALFHNRRAWAAARRDFEELLALGPADPVDVRLRLCRIDADSKRWRSAVEGCEALLEELTDPGSPKRGDALVVLGTACTQGADAELERLETRLAAAFTSSAFEVADELVVRITCLPLGSAEAVRAYDDLLAVFSEDGVLVPGDVAMRLDEIAALRERARRAYAESAETGLRQVPAAALVENWVRAGLVDDAATIADVAARQEWLLQHLEFLRAALAVLHEIGANDRAGEVARDWTIARGEQFIDLFTLKSLGEALYFAGEWDTLLPLAERFLEAAPKSAIFRTHRDTANFLLGAACAATGDDLRAREAYSAILGPEAEVQIEGATRVALEWLAGDARRSGSPAAELQYLSRLCGRYPVEAGENWLRLAELQDLTGADPTIALDSLTKAITALPGLTDVFEPRWREFARDGLERRGQLLAEAARQAVASKPPSELGYSPEDQVLLVEYLLEQGELSTARYVALLCAEVLPDFVPLVRLRFRAARAMKLRDEARGFAIDLVELGSIAPDVESFLQEEWERGATTPAEVYRIVGGASAEMATLSFLSGHLERGEPERALAELELWRAENAAADERPLAEIAALVHLELGDARSAWDELVTLPLGEAGAAGVIELFARAVADDPEPAHFDVLEERIAAAGGGGRRDRSARRRSSCAAIDRSGRSRCSTACVPRRTRRARSPSDCARSRRSPRVDPRRRRRRSNAAAPSRTTRTPTSPRSSSPS